MKSSPIARCKTPLAIIFFVLSSTVLYTKFLYRSDQPSTIAAPDGPSAGIDSAAIKSIIHQISTREYNISYDNKTKAYQSPNRAQNIRSYYKDGNWCLKNRDDSTVKWELKLRTKGIYADNKSLNPSPDEARVKLDENSINFVHSRYTEQYVNNDAGVRQNFLVMAPDKTSNLKVVLGYENMHGTRFGNSIHFVSKDAFVTYKDLKVWDASGRILESEMQLDTIRNEIALLVNAKSAIYPVTIDPIVVNGNPTNANALLEVNHASEQFGYNVSGAGDVNGDGYSDVIIGAFLYDNGQSQEGAAFIYHGSSTGINTTQAAMLESNQANARMGTSVSGAGDLNGDGFNDVIVGVLGYTNGQTSEGAAIVYYGSASGIVNSPTIIEPNVAYAGMGIGVSGAGDVNGDGYSDIIVGAYGYTNGESSEGVAFLYHGSSTGINITAASMLESNQVNGSMGYSVSGAGDVNGDGYSDVIVGAPYFDNGHTNEGATFVYLGSSGGINSASVVMAESNQANALFGYSVSSAGDVNGDGYSDLIAGAYGYSNGQTGEGAAFIFHGSATGTSNSFAVRLESNSASAQAGYSVSSAGDVNGDGYSDVIVGALTYTNGQSGEGAAFVYQGSSTGIKTTAVATIQSNQANGQLGQSVAGAGDVNGDGYSDIIIGAPFYTNGQNAEGVTFIYHGSAGGINTSVSTTMESNQIDAFLGQSVSTAGDTNGDGYDDVIIGANDYDNGQSGEGAVFIYYGSAAGTNLAGGIMVESNQAGAHMGESVSGGGDVNGDGYDDVIVGAYQYENGQIDEGATFIYYGSASGINMVSPTILESNATNAYAGFSVANAGDVNGDGFDDVIVGARGFQNGQSNEGAAYIYHGTASGINTTFARRIESNQATALMGWSVAGAGDINGDGFDDVIVGARWYDNGETDEGAAFVYQGSLTGIAPATVVRLECNQADANTGYSVAGVGDINGDGYSDIAVGAAYYDFSQTNEGAVFVYNGSATGISTVATTTIAGDQNLAYFGWSVASAGDVNGDGYSDLIAGSLYYNHGQSGEGVAFVYQGSATGINTANPTILEVNQVNAQFGKSVSGAGDVNGDGFGDVIVGATEYTAGESREGGGFLFLGNLSGGLRRNLSLYNTATTTRMQQSNISSNQFAAGLYVKNPDGRSKGKLVWETRSNGTPFSSASPITNSTAYTAQQASFSDLGVSGSLITNNIFKVSRTTRVRTRVRYNSATSINGEVFGPWIYPANNRNIPFNGPAPLALNALIFEATMQQNGQAILTWKTIHDDNTSHFELLKSPNGKDWISIARIIACEGIAGREVQYTEKDRAPFDGMTYYRLQIVDNAGVGTYSPVRIVERNGENVVTAFPNPTNGNITVNGEVKGGVAVFNSFGAQVNCGVIEIGARQRSVDLSSLPQGIYFLKTNDQVVRVVKE